MADEMFNKNVKECVENKGGGPGKSLLVAKL